jgi:hypothetical protein
MADRWIEAEIDHDSRCMLSNQAKGIDASEIGDIDFELVDDAVEVEVEDDDVDIEGPSQNSEGGTSIEHHESEEMGLGANSSESFEWDLVAPQTNLLGQFDDEGAVGTVNRLVAKGAGATEAIRKEIQQMVDFDVFEPVLYQTLDAQERTKIIGSMCFVQEKLGADGNFQKWKARLVVRGDQQSKEDLGDVYAPTVDTTRFKCVLAITSHRRFKWRASADAPCAFLRADEQFLVYVRLGREVTEVLVSIKPEYQVFVDQKGQMLVRLKKALYGTSEAPMLWNQKVTGTLVSYGYSQLKSDGCVFQKANLEDQVIICTHVDDFFIAATSEELFSDALQMLKAEFEVTASVGDKFSYLGLELDFSEPDVVSISQTGYEQGLIDEYPSKMTRKVTSPANDSLYTESAEGNAEFLPQAEQVFLRRGVARIGYLASRTRGDLLTAVMKLTTKVGKFSKEDMGKFNRLIAYLHQHRNMPLRLGSGSEESVTMTSYVDASHAVHLDMKSQSGCAISLGIGAVYVSSKKQKTVSKSSTEAELIALSDSVGVVLGIADFLVELGINVKENIIFQDNTSAILMATSGVAKLDSLRHIKIRTAQLSDLLGDTSNKLKLVHLPTEDMVADILTKAIHGERLVRLIGILQGHLSKD